MLEIRWWLRINDGDTPSNFYRLLQIRHSGHTTAYLWPHENSFGEFAICTEMPPSSRFNTSTICSLQTGHCCPTSTRPQQTQCPQACNRKLGIPTSQAAQRRCVWSASNSAISVMMSAVNKEIKSCTQCIALYILLCIAVAMKRKTTVNIRVAKQSPNSSCYHPCGLYVDLILITYSISFIFVQLIWLDDLMKTLKRNIYMEWTHPPVLIRNREHQYSTRKQVLSDPLIAPPRLNFTDTLDPLPLMFSSGCSSSSTASFCTPPSSEWSPSMSKWRLEAYVWILQ